ncbi:FAD:protein FMN transferase [Ideonella sp. DXS29W]|uniref:FAD:protein FMN transferase n=1 Tax=Ideonella lacteola TaxID=2984193 RepID=A0ABU9BJ71_9BURK
MTDAAASTVAARAPAPVVWVPPDAPWVTAPRDAVLHRWAGRSMGTVWRLVLAVTPQQPVLPVRGVVEGCLAELVRQMSHWEPESELSAFNRLAAGESMPLSPDFAHVMRMALEVAHQSGGAFDPTIAEAVQRWGFGPIARYDSPGFAPSPPVAPPVPESAPWRSLAWHEGRLRQPGGCRLDLSAIAKGHAVDAVGAALRALGFGSFLFELGGELRGEGLKPDGQPWWVAIERPPGGAHLPPLRAALIGQAVATSGDYRQGFRDTQGRWRSHTLDPRRGCPVEHDLASVTVLHRSAARADALATALFVMGWDEGLAWADQHRVAAWFTARDGAGGWREAATAALKDWLDD